MVRASTRSTLESSLRDRSLLSPMYTLLVVPQKHFFNNEWMCEFAARYRNWSIRFSPSNNSRIRAYSDCAFAVRSYSSATLADRLSNWSVTMAS